MEHAPGVVKEDVFRMSFGHLDITSSVLAGLELGIAADIREDDNEGQPDGDEKNGQAVSLHQNTLILWLLYQRSLLKSIVLYYLEMGRYRILPHTADGKFRAFGATREEAFAKRGNIISSWKKNI
jgi:hypothetical protein